MQIPYALFGEITRAVQGARHVLLVPHKNPDADSLGGALAFRALTNACNIPTTLFCTTPIPPQHQFLPGAQTVCVDAKIIRALPPDLIVVFDAGDAQYAGLDTVAAHLEGMPRVLNIDHHASNTNFGDLNCVLTHAASTTEIVFELLKFSQVSITREVALHLCAGVLTDTGIFSNPATTPRAMRIVAELVRSGAPYGALVRALERARPPVVFALWGRALKRLQRHPEYPLACTVIFERDLKELGVSDNDAQGISNFLNTITGVKITLVLRETSDGKVKGSFRSTADEVDLAALAMLFGGGGHRKAAGFAIPGRIQEIEGGWKIV